MIKGKYPDSSRRRNRQIGSIQLFTGVISFLELSGFAAMIKPSAIFALLAVV